MNNITYERDIYKSYMKIPSPVIETLDEKILLSKKIEGLLFMKKSYLDGEGQYWYDISGKQALDYYCKVNEVGIELLEQLILQICNQFERLEWNLVKEECLLLQPETIYINSSDESISFTGYPVEKGSAFHALREFMEFLLTKIDHSDSAAVHRAYEIYELMLKDELHIDELKQLILDRRVEKCSEEAEIVEEQSLFIEEKKENLMEELENSTMFQFYKDKIVKWIRNQWEILDIERFRKKRTEKTEMLEVVYPDEEEDIVQTSIHPTVCLTSMNQEARGLLLYEGTENFNDFEIGKLMCVIGKSHRVKLQIEKDTISHFHAKIDWRDEGYYIEDMNSTNGTYVNEELLKYRESRRLQSGDIIRFADVKYRFV